jgi:prepilin-type N-terminal cleavage/methylation domain-containing protein
MRAGRLFNVPAKGFTLLEVVVAMTIVGLGVVTLLEIFSLGLRLGARSAARTEATTRGRQVIDEFLVRRDLREGTEAGVMGVNGRWSVQVQPVRDPSSAHNLSSPWELKEVSVDMVVTEAGRERRVELKTLRLVRKNNP